MKCIIEIFSYGMKYICNIFLTQLDFVRQQFFLRKLLVLWKLNKFESSSLMGSSIMITVIIVFFIQGLTGRYDRPRCTGARSSTFLSNCITLEMDRGECISIFVACSVCHRRGVSKLP